MTKYDPIREDLSKLLDIVSSYYDVNKKELFVSNKANVVDARYSLIALLCEKYKDSDISIICGLSKSVVNKIRNAINVRCKNRTFNIGLNNVKNLFCSL